MLPRSRINPDNPQTSEMTFFLSPISICIQSCLLNCIFSSFEVAAPGTIVALGLLHYFAMSSVPRHRTICSRHYSLLFYDHSPDAFFFSFINQIWLTHLPFCAVTPANEHMAMVCFVSSYFTSTCQTKSFGGTASCFLLWH